MSNGQVHSSGLVVRQAALERAEPPRWAWQKRLVLGYLNLLLGNEGVGKGTLVAWLIARLTHGELPGDLEGQPVAVGILGDEDSFDGVWTPRLHAAGADLRLIFQIERPDGGFVNLREDHEKLRAAVSEGGIRVLFFDQLLDNLGVGVDDWRNKAVRDALQPLRAIARSLDVSAIGCMHPNKRADSFRQLVAGAPAFNAVSRSSLLLADHPDDDDRRVLVRGKGNLAERPEAVEFELRSFRFYANGHTFNVPRAVDFATSSLTVDDLLNQPAELPPAGHARTAARELIADALSGGAWVDCRPILSLCAKQGVYDRAARRALKDLGGEWKREGYQGDVYWRIQTGHSAAPSAEAVRPVRSVRTDEAKTALNGRGDSVDTTDSGHTRDTPVRTGNSGALGLPDGLTLEDAEALASEYAEEVASG